MSQPTISIIANFYNSGKYIPRLLKSIFTQSFTDWEIIAIDDCSPNHDDQIIRKFIRKHTKNYSHDISSKTNIIRNEKNLGISKAKLVGIKAAKGKYILFMDGDDWLEKEALANLVTPALKYDLDLVIGNHYRVIMPWGIKGLRCSAPKEYNVVVEGEECRKYWRVMLTAIGINSVAYWAKLYKREVILKSDWEAQKTYDVEDHKFNCTVFPHVKKLMFIDKPVYNWRCGGITSGVKNYQTAIDFMYKYLDLNIYKKELLIKYHSEDLIPIIQKRAIDYFYWCTLCKITVYPTDSDNASEIKLQISKLLNHPAITYALTLPNNSFEFEILRNNDLDKIYNHLHNIYKSQRKRRLQVRIMQLLSF